MANGWKTGGRQKGTPNRATADIKALAQQHGPAAIAELARLSGLTDAPGALTEAARVACLRELLDRGYGKATTLLGSDRDMPVAISFEWAPATPQVDAEAARDIVDTTGADVTDHGDNEDKPIPAIVWRGDTS